MPINLNTINDYTLLEIFEYVKEHLLTQNKQSLNKRERRCKYRYKNRKCAIGCLIPDEEYDSLMDSEEYSLLSNFVDTFYPHILKEDLEWFSLLKDLQTIHDYYPPKKWEKLLNNLKRRRFKENSV